MLTRLANIGIRAPKRVLGIAGLLIVAAAVFGISVAGHLSAGGFTDPSSQSARANDLLATKFHTGDVNLVLEVTSARGVDAAPVRQQGLHLTSELSKAKYVNSVSSYWTAPGHAAAGLVDRSHTAALITARVAGDDSAAPKRAASIIAPLVGNHDGVTVRAGGIAPTYHQVNDHVSRDLALSEAVAIPLTTIALIWVFGSMLAALLPLAIGITSIIGTMAVLRLIASVTDVSIYALNMTTALGLALAIDYSLFVVSRYREEIRAGRPGPDAVRRAMQTAGRTVLFSALTVALSLSAMLVFPLYFLRSFAYAGVAVVALATVAALVLLPALLTLLGKRVDAWDLRAFVRRRLRRPAPVAVPVQQGFWYRFATAVMRRAIPVGLLVTAVLVALGLPFRNVHFGYPDERVLPPSATAYQVGADLRSNFPTDAGSNIEIVVAHLGARSDAVASYAAAVSRVHGVTAVASPAGMYVHGTRTASGAAAMHNGGAAYLVAQTKQDPQSAAAKDTVAAIRALPAPWPVLLSGMTAEDQDSLSALGSALPYAALIIVLATFFVLFLFTGSLVLPIKALVLNTLSLTATFGAMVWVFQEGHLHWLYPNLTVTGYLTPAMPPLMFCLAFGLSMDYEVFLLSRIREEWLNSDRSVAANTRAVALGLGRTGRIVTAAALLMAIVFAAIAASSVSFMMLFGTGLTLAVLMDATVVRGTLVPAFMRLAGRWNWWAPRPLARLHERIGLSEEPSGPVHASRESELVTL
jgi:putative drug exporter of the RND superfamily